MQNSSGLMVNVGIAIIILLLLGIIRFFFNKNIFELIEKFRQNNFNLRQIKEELNVRTTASTVFNLFSYAMLSVLVYIYIDFNKIKIMFDKREVFLVCLILVPLAILLKRLVLLFIGNIFRASHFVKVYLFQMSLTRKTLGLLIAPLASIYFAFSHKNFIVAITFYFTIMAVLLVVAFTLYKIISALTKNSSFGFSLHFFLYLCAIEILPILIFIKKIS